MSTQTFLFDQDYVDEMRKHEIIEESKDEWLKEGAQKKMEEVVSILTKQGMLDAVKILSKKGKVKK